MVVQITKYRHNSIFNVFNVKQEKKQIILIVILQFFQSSRGDTGSRWLLLISCYLLHSPWMYFVFTGGKLTQLSWIAFQFCKTYDVEFLTWRCWIGFWVMIILFGVVALEGCFLIKYFTRFTEDIFELLISAIFIYEPIALLIKVTCYWLQT